MPSRPDNKNKDNATRLSSEDRSYLPGEPPASYEEVFALVPVACVITRLADGLILAVNDEWCALTGITRSVALGSTSTQLGIWRDSEHRSRFLAAREDLNHLYALRAASGDQRMVRIRTRVLRSRDTELLVVSLTQAAEEAAVRTDLQRSLEGLSSANQALRSQLDLLGEIAQRVPGLMYQAVRYPDGRSEIKYMSDPAVRMLELGPNEHKTDPRALFSRFHPDEIPRILEDLEQCGADGTDLRERYRIRLPSGALRWFRFEASPRRQSDGSVLWHGYVADVTEEHSTRAAMERQQQLLQAVSTALSLYISSDGKSEVFTRLLESICEVVRPSASFLVEMASTASVSGERVTSLRGTLLGTGGTSRAFQLEDPQSLELLLQGRAAVLLAGHPCHAAMSQGTGSNDPLVVVPLQLRSDLVGLVGLHHPDPRAVTFELGFLEPLTRAAAQILLAWRGHSERASTLKRLAEAGEQLKAERRALQIVLDSMGQGLARLEADGRISFYNRRLLELLDVPESLMASRPTHAQISAYLASRGEFGERYELVDAAGREYVKATGDAQAPEVYLRRTPQGRYLEIGTLPLPEGGAVRTITDVTQYMVAQEELATERQRLAWVLEATRPGIWENNLQNDELKINSRWAEIVGYTLEELSPVSSETWRRLVHPDDLVRADAARDVHIAGKAPYYECDVRMRHKDGHWVWINTHGRVHRRASDGEPLYMSGMHLDISDRVKAQEALSALNDNLERLVAERTRSLERTLRDMEAIAYSIAHDLRTPLRSVNGFATVLLESEVQHLSEAGTRSLQRIVGASARMGQMLTEMLEVLAVVRAEIVEETVDVQALAIDIDHQLGLRASGVELRIDPMPRALGDPRLIKQALRNLMDNAWKYARDRHPPRVHVGFDREKNAYFVRDNGVGFDMAQAPKLFGLFQRLHGDASVPGLGIGLAICARIVERHAGRIWAEAKPGVGATFWMKLPGPG